MPLAVVSQHSMTLTHRSGLEAFERHVRDKTKPVAQPAFLIFALIRGHTTGLFSLRNLLEQKGVIALLAPQDISHVMGS